MRPKVPIIYPAILYLANRTSYTVLRSTAPAPLGVRKVHKTVYNISSIFNLGLALRALAAVPLFGVMLGLGWGYVRFVVGVMLGLWLGLC